MEILSSLIIICAGIFVMMQAGKVVVRSLGVVARYLKVSEYVISFILIAFATSLPELSVGINSALVGVPELSFGDIIGTNIVNFCLILGLVAIVGKDIELEDYTHFKSNRVYQFIALLSPLVLTLDGMLSRVDGVILIAFFGLYLVRLFNIDDKILGRKVLRPHLAEHAHESTTTRKTFWKHVLKLIFGAAALLGSALLIINSVKTVSSVWGISEATIGILLLAFCTSLPDLIIGIRSANSEKGGMALGDIFGATTINATLTLGTVALISPFTLSDRSIVWVGITFIAASTLTIFYLLKSKHSLSRREGYVLFGMYILFVITELGVSNLWH